VTSVTLKKLERLVKSIGVPIVVNLLIKMILILFKKVILRVDSLSQKCTQNALMTYVSGVMGNIHPTIMNDQLKRIK
jgi:hypothetical protein